MRSLSRLMSVLALGATCALSVGPAVAQQRGKTPAASVDSPALPEWEQLPAAQREQLIAPVRERWNAQPAQRDRMLRHAARWSAMTPEERAKAHMGAKRLQAMSPAERMMARATFERLRQMSPAERATMRKRLQQMTPEQRKAWLESGVPGAQSPTAERAESRARGERLRQSP